MIKQEASCRGRSCLGLCRDLQRAERCITQRMSVIKNCMAGSGVMNIIHSIPQTQSIYSALDLWQDEHT